MWLIFWYFGEASNDNMAYENKSKPTLAMTLILYLTCEGWSAGCGEHLYQMHRHYVYLYMNAYSVLLCIYVDAIIFTI